MNIICFEIENYRSIKKMSIPIERAADGTLTFGLVGVNEAGKSSILKALALTQFNRTPSIKDFQIRREPIVIKIKYSLNQSYTDDLLNHYSKVYPDIFKKIDKPNHVIITFSYQADYDGKMFVVKTMDLVDTTGNEFNINPEMEPLKYMHTPVFWTAEDKYLISQPINIDEFAKNPDEISIPLKNCFLLAGYKDIKNIRNIIHRLQDSTDYEHLQDTLGEAVTKHICEFWPGHPVRITFAINDRKINFHIKDEGSSSKAIIVDQRSDGFKQFLSFLLTITADSKNNQLNNKLLLIDEPEAHLHPKAQLYFLKQLKEITIKSTNNIVFYATHSTFMIDKNDLSRNFRVLKKGDETIIEKFDKESITYNAVNYEVFEIYSTDYHNELYAKLHAKFQEENVDDLTLKHIKPFDEKFFHKQHKLKKNKNWMKTENDATLPTYIRNCINHADNGFKYSEEELIESTDFLRDLVQKNEVLSSIVI